MRAWARAWLPALLYMALIFAISSVRVSLPAVPILSRDKLIHAVEFGVLGFLVGRASLLTWPGIATPRVGALAWVITFAFGFSDELHQAFVPGRSSELADLVADGFGGALGVLLSIVWVRKRGSRA